MNQYIFDGPGFVIDDDEDAIVRRIFAAALAAKGIAKRHGQRVDFATVKAKPFST